MRTTDFKQKTPFGLFPTAIFGLVLSLVSGVAHADCTLTNLTLTPLPELGLMEYNGRPGGLYPHGANNPPPAHLADGLPNLLEYAMGLDPKTRETSTNDLPVATLANGYFTLTWPHYKPAADVTLSLEVSTDLVSWAPTAAPQTTDLGIVEAATIREPTVSSQARSFRFKALRNAGP